MKRLTLRIDTAIYEKIKFIASKNRRSINNEIAFALSEYILNFIDKSGVGEREDDPGENAFSMRSGSSVEVGFMHIKKEKK